MLEEQIILLGIELYSYVNSSFCFSMQIWLLVTWAKTLYTEIVLHTPKQYKLQKRAWEQL